MHVAPDKSKRTNDRGLKRWRIDCKLEQQSGKPGFPSRHIRKNAEGKPFTKKADAEAYMAVLNNQVENYGGVSSRDQTFGDAIDALLASFDGRAANGDGTVAHYRKLRAMIETHIPSIKIDGVPLSTIKLSYIDGDLIEDNLMSEIRDRPVGSRTQSEIWSQIKQALRLAVRRKWITHNPSDGIKGPKSDRSARKAVKREVFETLSQQFDNYIHWVRRLDADAELPIVIASRMGLRASEMMALSLDRLPSVGQNEVTIDRAWKHVDKSQYVIGLPKHEKVRKVSISSRWLNELRLRGESQHGDAPARQHNQWSVDQAIVSSERLIFGGRSHQMFSNAWDRAQFAKNGYLLTVSGKQSKKYSVVPIASDISDEDLAHLRSGQHGVSKGSTRTDAAEFDTKAEAAAHCGITLLTWHDLRHFYASMLFNADFSIGRITDLMGHSEEKVTREYYREWISNNERASEEADALEAMFG